MSNNNTVSLATVAEISGKVWAVADDGTRRLLKMGDAVYEEEVILTEDGSQAVLKAANGADLKFTENVEVVLSSGLFGYTENTFSLNLRGMIGANDSSGLLIATNSSQSVSLAAGKTLGGIQNSHGYLRVERILESVTIPVYRLWSYTGNYNSANQFRTTSYNLILDGRATVDERLRMPLEPLTFYEVELLPVQQAIPGAIRTSILTVNDVPKNNTTEVTGSVQEDALPNGNRDTVADTTEATGSVAGLVDTGADVPVIFSLQTTGLDALGLTSNGVALIYSVSGSTLTAIGPDGPVFTLTLSGTDNATYTFTLLGQLDHPAGSGDDATISLDLSSAVLVTDNNGDAITVDGGFSILVENDIPVGTGSVSGNVDEDELLDGITDNDGVTTVAKGSIAALFLIGADQSGSYGLSGDTSGLPELTSTGVPVLYEVTGNTLMATAGGNTIFTLVIDSVTGDYSFTLLHQIDHPVTDGDDNEILSLNLTSILKAIDADGDQSTSSGTFLINIEDDVPVGSGTVEGAVQEDALPGGNREASQQTTIATGSIAGLFLIGADQPGSYGLSADTGGLPALTSAGVPVSYSVSGNTLTATAGGNTVFTLVIDSSTGNYTFELLDQLDHPRGDGDDNEILSLDLTSILQVADADGDPVTTSGRFTINVEDDVPVGTGTVVGNVDEDELPGGNPDGDEVYTIATGNIAGLFSIGADQSGSFGLSSDTSGLPSLTSGGVDVTYAVLGNTLTASAGGNTVFTLSIDAMTGAYTFELEGQLDHPTADDDDNEILSLDLTSILTETDKDGDVVTTSGSFTINVEDDVPVGTALSVTGNVDEDELPDGISDGDGETTVSTGSIAGLFKIGADQPGSYGINAGIDGTNVQTVGGVDVTSEGTQVTYKVVNATTIKGMAGTREVFTLTLDASTGGYTFTLQDQLDHPTADAAQDDEELGLKLGVTLQATDKDGDVVTTSGSFTINVEDDVPVGTVLSVTGNVDEDELTDGITDDDDRDDGRDRQHSGTVQDRS